MNLQLSDFAAIAVIGSAVSGILYWLLRGRLSAVFVSRVEHDETLGRLKEIEARLELVPSREDLTRIQTTVSEMRHDVGVLTERSSGQKDSLARIERQLELFIQAQLEQERARV
jgi:tetrahydromethanopterin S-methyltransferase subunit G